MRISNRIATHWEHDVASQRECLAQALHVGGRFTASGNNAITRDCCGILWVANPEKTGFFIKLLLADMRA